MNNLKDLKEAMKGITEVEGREITRKKEAIVGKDDKKEKEEDGKDRDQDQESTQMNLHRRSKKIELSIKALGEYPHLRGQGFHQTRDQDLSQNDDLND